MSGLYSGFILVGVDGTQESLAALRWALARAAGAQQAVKIVHCQSTVMPDVARRTPPRQRRDGAMRASDGAVFASEAAVRASEAAVRAIRQEVDRAQVLVPQPELSIISAPGNAESVLVSQARRAALLVLGAAHPSVLDDPATGTIAGPCLRNVACPVVVVDRQTKATVAHPRYPVLGLAV